MPLSMRDAMIDRYLGACVKSAIRRAALPAWTAGLDDHHERILQRLSFHGIALLLWECDVARAGWPPALRERMREEATAQSFWEQSHRPLVARLLGSMLDAGVEPIVMKGTALAYSLYSTPAARRRGDTDILVPRHLIAPARKVLEELGFERQADRMVLQETWLRTERGGFDHLVDLHWRIDGSAAVASHLERGDLAARTIPLRALGERVVGLGALANLLLISINRSEHHLHGYVAGAERVFDGDRLIWAVDIDACCACFAQSDWEELSSIARTTGAAASIASGLAFAQRTLGTCVPAHIMQAIAGDRGAAALNSYLSTASAWARLKLDIAHSPRLADKLGHLMISLLPRTQVLQERFPEHAHWPAGALAARRLIEGLAKAARGRL